MTAYDRSKNDKLLRIKLLGDKFWHRYCHCSSVTNRFEEMETVETTFVLTYTDEQYERAKRYVEDMKRHRNRVFWIGKEGKSDEELIISHIAHKILSGFYNNYDPSIARGQIKDMKNQKAN